MAELVEIFCHAITVFDGKLPHFREKVISSTLVADFILCDNSVIGFFGIFSGLDLIANVFTEPNIKKLAGSPEAVPGGFPVVVVYGVAKCACRLRGNS
jgi:hypothetical protein